MGGRGAGGQDGANPGGGDCTRINIVCHDVGGKIVPEVVRGMVEWL